MTGVQRGVRQDAVELVGDPPDETGTFIRAEMARWPKIVKVEG